MWLKRIFSKKSINIFLGRKLTKRKIHIIYKYILWYNNKFLELKSKQTCTTQCGGLTLRSQDWFWQFCQAKARTKVIGSGYRDISSTMLSTWEGEVIIPALVLLKTSVFSFLPPPLHPCVVPPDSRKRNKRREVSSAIQNLANNDLCLNHTCPPLFSYQKEKTAWSNSRASESLKVEAKFFTSISSTFWKLLKNLVSRSVT